MLKVAQKHKSQRGDTGERNRSLKQKHQQLCEWVTEQCDKKPGVPWTSWDWENACEYIGVPFEWEKAVMWHFERHIRQPDRQTKQRPSRHAHPATQKSLTQMSQSSDEEKESSGATEASESNESDSDDDEDDVEMSKASKVQDSERAKLKQKGPKNKPNRDASVSNSTQNSRGRRGLYRNDLSDSDDIESDDNLSAKPSQLDFVPTRPDNLTQEDKLIDETVEGAENKVSNAAAPSQSPRKPAATMTNENLDSQNAKRASSNALNDSSEDHKAKKRAKELNLPSHLPESAHDSGTLMPVRNDEQGLISMQTLQHGEVLLRMEVPAVRKDHVVTGIEHWQMPNRGNQAPTQSRLLPLPTRPRSSSSRRLSVPQTLQSLRNSLNQTKNVEASNASLNSETDDETVEHRDTFARGLSPPRLAPSLARGNVEPRRHSSGGAPLRNEEAESRNWDESAFEVKIVGFRRDERTGGKEWRLSSAELNGGSTSFCSHKFALRYFPGAILKYYGLVNDVKN